MELNLLEILKDVSKETIFYSPVIGDCYIKCINNEKITISTLDNLFNFTVLSNGKAVKNHGECLLFPSKDQRNWFKSDRDPIIGTPCMCKEYDDTTRWVLRTYAGEGRVFINGSECNAGTTSYRYIIPVTEFDFIEKRKKVRNEY